MLRISNLTHAYSNGVRALDNVNLEIPPGMFGLLGPNGAGKSTLMRTIATLQAPSKGEIDFGGLNVLREPEELRKRLGYLPQDFGVYPRVTARNMLNHMAILKGFANGRERRELVDALLHKVNLWDARNKAIASFSGGMRQRFGIAQALIGDPKLIIVDEPTAGLDPEERNRFLNLLAAIGDGVVVILSTHIVADVLELCPRMAILAKGRVAAEGVPRELTESLSGKVWRKTIPRDKVDDYKARLNVISTRLFAGQTIIHVLADTRPEDGFEQIEPGLEDFYFATLGAVRAGKGQ